MEVSSLNLPGLALDFPWEPHIHDVNGGGVHQGDLTTGTATTSTAVMPVLLTHNQPAAVDTTLPLDPSFVDIEHPGLGRKTPVPSKRKASVAGSGTTRTTTTSSSTSASKVRSVSTPTPSTNVHSAPRSSSKSRGHRSTKSHGNFHQEDHIQEDLLLNLLKEFRAAKKKEREGGGSTDAGTGSVSLSLGVKSLLSHAARRPQPHHEPNAAQDHSSPPSYDSTTRPGSPDGARPAPQKTRQRSASTSTPSKPRTQSKSNSGSSAEVILLLGTLRQETRRANAAEAQLNELLDRYKVMRQERLNAESQLAVIREELKLYKEQLDAAQKEIYRAQQIVDSVDRQRVLAEQDAQRNRERCRKLFEERLVAQAQEEGRREGYEEGMRRGRLAREEQERQIELEREQERAKRRRERDRERQRREEDRQEREREREREEEERRQQERERLEMERRERVRLELERLKRDREERERREREKLEAARRERERSEAEQLERRRQEVELRRQEEEMRRKEYEEWDRKAKHKPTQRARSNTLAGATAHSTVPPTHRSRARSGSVPGLSRPTNVLSPPPRPPTPPPPLPAKPASPEHRAARSRTPGPSYRSYTPNIPIASSSTTPAGDPPLPHGRRSSPPNPSTSIVSMPYVPLPPPPANYIPVMNKDGSVLIPPPFGFKSPPRNNDGATARPPPGPSSRAGDSVRGYANPDRERMRQRIIGVGSPETPTPRPGSTFPGARPFSRQGDHKGKGKMRVVNENDSEWAQERPKATESPPNGFPWFAPASEVVYPTVESPSPPPASNPHRQAPIAMFTSTPPKKPISPPPPGSGPHNANQSARSSGEESRWLLPPDFSYVGGHPAMTPMLVRTATNGTTPTIGVEPPSHSPTTEGEASTAMDSGLLTADGTVAHHDREPEEHEHHSPPETTTPQSYTYQPGPMTTPTDPIPPWNYTSPPQGQPPQYQRYDTNGSASWVSNWNPNPISPPQWGAMGGSSPGSRTGSVQEKSGWVPPPIVPLSPIPGSMSMDYKFNAFAPMSSTGSPGSRVVSPGNEKEPLTFGMVGTATTGTGKFLSPAPLNRPISLFSDSDG